MVEKYSEDSIQTLDWKEHIRRRPGMYIGKLGDGSAPDDGVYILLKEVFDNSIDEFMMGNGKKIDVEVTEKQIRIRDYGRGIPLGKVIDVSSKMNTGAKYDSTVFKKSVGLNGVGIKAVNALSEQFIIRSFREGRVKEVIYSGGNIIEDKPETSSSQPNGVEIAFIPDNAVFGKYRFTLDYIETMMRNYVYLNSGLTINFNDKKFFSKNGLLDLLNENMNTEGMYPIIHLKGEDIEVAITHGNQYGEEIYSFVNGQHTTQGGTHLLAFREAYVKTVRDFFKKDFDAADIRSSIIAAVSIKVEEPIFESQTKTKLGSKNITPEGMSVRQFIGDFLSKVLDDFLHKNQEVAKLLLAKIQESEKERKAISGIKKLARDRAKTVSFYNRGRLGKRLYYQIARCKHASSF